MARKKKKNKGILENKLSIAFVTTVVLAMAIALGVKVNSIKKELASREAYNQKVVEKLDSEEQRAKKLEEQRKYVQTDSYIIEMAREKLGLVFPNEIAIKAAKEDVESRYIESFHKGQQFNRKRRQDSTWCKWRSRFHLSVAYTE